MADMNIYQKINAVMKECDYLQKKQAQQGKGIKYDEVIAMLRELLIKYGIVPVMRQKSMECISGVEGTKQKVFEGYYELDLINMDNPSEVVTHSTFAHGMDGGDKAPGKAHTYAAKLMYVKGFAIETGEDEESRAEKMEKLKTIDEPVQDQICQLIGGDQALWDNLCKAYNITHLNQIPISKESEIKSRIAAYKERKSKNANN